MDQPLISTGLEQLLQFAILLFVVVGFFRQFATQRDIKDLKDTIENVDSRLGNVETRLGNVETRLGTVETRLDRVEENVRENGKKVDASMELHNAVQVDLKVLQASVDRLESYFETPKLKSS